MHDDHVARVALNRENDVFFFDSNFGKRIHISRVFFFKKKLLWDQLRALDTRGTAWFVGGYFNTIRYNEEKLCGILTSSTTKRDFNSVIQDPCLIEVPFDGPKLSWCNGRNGARRIWAQLDRVLVN